MEEGGGNLSIVSTFALSTLMSLFEIIHFSQFKTKFTSLHLCKTLDKLFKNNQKLYPT